MAGLSTTIERIWYQCRGINCLGFLLLLPLSCLFYALSGGRRAAYRWGMLRQQRLPKPVIVVGNISVGGTGKTPMVTYLVERLREYGYQAGVISRGYGGRASTTPQPVTPDSDPAQVGDEAVLLARRCQCPVVVGADRVAAGQLLLEQGHCDVVISDDGLQHYRLARDLEIVMIDGERGLGNAFLLPAGPLREGAWRLATVDFVVSTAAAFANADTQQLRLKHAINLKNPHNIKDLSNFCGADEVIAVAGIGHPQRFFRALAQQGIRARGVAFADHHAFRAQDFEQFPQHSILMTEKDAVKCAAIANENMWYVPVESYLQADFERRLREKLIALIDTGRHTTN